MFKELWAKYSIKVWFCDSKGNTIKKYIMKTFLLKSNQTLRYVKNSSLLIAAMGISLFSNAQTWGTQSSGIADNINGLAFSKSSNIGFAVAAGGRILKTASGGISWSLVNSGTVNNLNAIAFANNMLDTGYIVGDSGTVLMTNNGGSSWNAITSGTTAKLNDVCIKDGEGFIVGDNGVILHVSGTTINTLSSNTTNNLLGVHMLNKTTAVAVGGGILSSTLLATYNSGAVWSPISTGSLSQLNDAYFVNDSTAYVVGNSGTILKTTNSGSSWTSQTSGSISNINAICFIGTDTGFIAGASGAILKTVNGGTSWSTLTSGTTNDLNDIAFVDAYKGYASGNAGTIIKTCPTAMFDMSPNDSVCVNSNLDFVNTSKNSNSYTWLKNGDTVSTSMNYSFMFDSAGSYTITLIADNGTCTNTISHLVRVAAAPNVDLGPDTTICHTCTIVLDAGNIGSTYKWYREGVATGIVTRTNTVGVEGTYSVEVTSGFGCMSTDSIVISYNTGLADVAGNINGLLIYPNANNKVFNIDFTVNQKTNTTVTITNIIGEVVYSENLNDFSGKYTKQISLESSSSGVYFVKVQSGESAETMKVITY